MNERHAVDEGRDAARESGFTALDPAQHSAESGAGPARRDETGDDTKRSPFGAKANTRAIGTDAYRRTQKPAGTVTRRSSLGGTRSQKVRGAATSTRAGASGRPTCGRSSASAVE